MSFIEPITDRTKDDVDYVLRLKDKGYVNLTDSERTEWNEGLKGALNASDLIRIENNIQYISDLFGLGLTTYDGKIPILPKQSYFEKMLFNVDSIRKSLTIYTKTPITPSEVSTYMDVNNIEQILADVMEIYNNRWTQYTGEGFRTGEYLGTL